MALQDQRNHIHALQQFFLAHNHLVGYIQHRPMATAEMYEHDLYNLIVVQKGQITPDCSEMVTLICRLAGLKPPSGPSFPYADGEGNSTSMWKYLPHYTHPGSAHTGAICAYGVDGDDHVNMVMEPDPIHGNPMMFNHGGPNGPIEVRYLDMVASFPAGTPVTMLDISPL